MIMTSPRLPSSQTGCSSSPWLRRIVAAKDVTRAKPGLEAACLADSLPQPCHPDQTKWVGDDNASLAPLADHNAAEALLTSAALVYPMDTY